ncbi:unnamed protein product [Macrosiphum euphorbiae]|uniref:Uncharacterized protein n=1 Tax=Macrosiphum euphorbiae TaxID=13131 RepID=A0AAV0VTD3_9HEMI|nr:unnamed protein product [Macrosiphum euphorbiae]
MWYSETSLSTASKLRQPSPESDSSPRVYRGSPGRPRGAKPMKITFGRNDTPPPREVPDTPKFAGDKTTLIKLMATTKRPTFVNAYTAPMFYGNAERRL